MGIGAQISLSFQYYLQKLSTVFSSLDSNDAYSVTNSEYMKTVTSDHNEILYEQNYSKLINEHQNTKQQFKKLLKGDVVS
jgi:hypothetical protein